MFHSLRPVVSALCRLCAPSFLLLMAMLAFSLLVAPDVRAGTYSGPVYSGGTYTNVGPGNTPLPDGINPSTGLYGSVATPGYYIGGSSGQITAKFTWQPAYPGDPPPASVIVYQHAVAQFSFQAITKQTASCSDGLGDTEQDTTAGPPSPAIYNGVSSGTYYTVQAPDGSGNVTLTCSPAASFNWSAPGVFMGGASVGYAAAVYPVTVNLGGAIQDSSGNLNILIGQGCKASMSAGPATLSNFQWSASPIFDQFLIASDQSSGYATFLSAAALTQPSPTWHWYLDSGGGSFMVSCSATATANGTVIGTVSGQQQVKVWAPYYYMNHNAGPTGIYGSDVSTGAQSLVPPGMAFVGAVGTPALFANTLGTGSWLFVQIINTSHYQWYPWSPIPVKSGSLGVALDNEWPYIPGWPADSTANASTPHPAEDSPDLGLLNLVDQFTVNDIYQMYLMYLPPDNGYGSQYVPLHRVTWEWNANGTLAGTWPAGSSGQVTVDSDLRWETHPTWSQIYINSHK